MTYYFSGYILFSRSNKITLGGIDLNNYFRLEQEQSRYFFEQVLVLSTVKGHLKGTIKHNESSEVVKFATMLLGIINEDLAAVEEEFANKKEMDVE